MEQTEQLINGMTEREYYNSLMKDDVLPIPFENRNDYDGSTVRCRNKNLNELEIHRNKLKDFGYEVSEIFPVNLWDLKDWSGFRLNVKKDKMNGSDWQYVLNWSIMYGSPTKEELGCE